MYQRKRFRRTSLISCGLAAFLCGLALAKVGLIVSFAWVLLAAALVLVTYKSHSVVTAVCIILLGLVAGSWRASSFVAELTTYRELEGQSVAIIGEAEADAVYSDRGQLTFDITHMYLEEPYEGDLVGKVKIEGFGEPAVFRGDVVKVEGKLYPTRGSRQARISFADLRVISRDDSVVEDLRHRFEAGMRTALPEPVASFGLGLLVGQRSSLPDRTNQSLSRAGLTHLVAVSGYNLTIIVMALRRILGRRSKYQATMLSLALIGVFLLITGLSPSIVRAAIVAGLSLGAWYYGRQIRPILLLLLAAALTAGWYPFYIWSDIGWYLSFLAFFGVFIVAPLVATRFRLSEKRRPVTMVVIETLTAQLMTAPLILFIFGEISSVSLLANTLVVPLVPLAMLLSLAAGLAGWFAPLLAGWFAWPARLLLTYMLDVAELLGRIPHALSKMKINVWHMVVLYASILVWIIALRHRIRGRNAIIKENKAS